MLFSTNGRVSGLLSLLSAFVSAGTVGNRQGCSCVAQAKRQLAVLGRLQCADVLWI